ncbi:MAG: Fe-S cluster assembly protein SufB [Candidatus Omnitrophica bacterium]|nr:Fe-S cluster assembly protein SufB [Candidatus Omnitrophota bacterium]
MSAAKPNVQINEDYEKLYGFHVPEHAVFKAELGLDEGKVRQISGMKGEPSWMLDFRLRGFRHYRQKPMPQWANTELLNSIKFDDIYYYLKPTEKKSESWEDVPAEIKETFDRLGIPEAERKFLAGVSAQYESESVYHSMREDLQKQGVIFLDMDTGLKEQPEIVKRYFGTVIPPADNKFAALNTATWSGGSFIYVPKGIKDEMPLQAYFRINAKNMGQFERTLIIADEGAEVTYIEGCTAPSYSSDSLHSAVVELIALPHAKLRYVTIQNWSKNVYNLVTKRAIAHEGATVEWLDGNLGCVGEGERVYSESGPTPIEAVQPGTRVWSFDESARQWLLCPVVARKDSGEQQVYEVRCSNGRAVRLTANHPLLKIHRDPSRPKKLGRYSLRWTPLEELSVGDWIVYPTALPTEGVVHRFRQPVLNGHFTGKNQYGASYTVNSHARLPIALPREADEDALECTARRQGPEAISASFEPVRWEASPQRAKGWALFPRELIRICLMVESERLVQWGKAQASAGVGLHIAPSDAPLLPGRISGRGRPCPEPWGNGEIG